MKIINCVSVLFLSLFFFASAFAQTSAKIEQDLVGAIKEVQQYSTYGDDYNENKLGEANDAFEKSLLKYTKNAATLKYIFPKLSDLIIIATSDDGKFRTYSWDEGTGGTMHDCTVIYQFQGADGKIYSRTDKKVTAEDGGVGSFVNSIYTVNAKTGNIYVVCTTFIGSTIDHYGAADLFAIKGSELVNNVKLFKTKLGLTDSIGFEYNYFSFDEHPETPVKLIRFDKNSQTLKIPIVINDKEFPNGRVTNKFINYKFDGTYFVKIN